MVPEPPIPAPEAPRFPASIHQDEGQIEDAAQYSPASPPHPSPPPRPSARTTPASTPAPSSIARTATSARTVTTAPSATSARSVPNARTTTNPYPAESDSDPKQEPVFAEGIVEVSGKGFGFLRDPKRNFVQSPTDVFVTPEVFRRYALRDGIGSKAKSAVAIAAPKCIASPPSKARTRPTTATPPLRGTHVHQPQQRISSKPSPIATPRASWTSCPPSAKASAASSSPRRAPARPPSSSTSRMPWSKTIPRSKLIILLVDERPEEVTEFRRALPAAEIMASSNDMDIKSHTRIAQLAIERARRLVEIGKDVFVLLDSITRVGRAFNNAIGGGGRTMSGGIDARALEIPRKIFASARNTEEAGSLTIIATALIETGSRMDEHIFQEFKGTGNMELVLDRKISDLRVYPAIDIFKSGTRREELLVPADQLHKINIIRRGLAGHKPEEAIERLLSFVRKFPQTTRCSKRSPGSWRGLQGRPTCTYSFTFT